MAKQKHLKFKDWVESAGGIKVVAEKFNVGEHQVRSWLRGEGTPTVQKIVEIIKISRAGKHELTFDDIYKECTRNKIK